MAAHLACEPEPGPASQSLAQQASYFLLAVSIRSASRMRCPSFSFGQALLGRI